MTNYEKINKSQLPEFTLSWRKLYFLCRPYTSSQIGKNYGSYSDLKKCLNWILEDHPSLINLILFKLFNIFETWWK